MDPVAEQGRERVVGSRDAEGRFELLEHGVREVGVWPRAAQDASDDPVGAGSDSVERRVPRRQQEVCEPAWAADREGVAVEEDDPACLGGMIECVEDGESGAERVADDEWSPESEPASEAVDELHPTRERVRAASL